VFSDAENLGHGGENPGDPAPAGRPAVVECVERGYGATTIGDIAAAAGVSRATVFASAGAKPALLKAAFDATPATTCLSP
jgi:hypothetical protein